MLFFSGAYAIAQDDVRNCFPTTPGTLTPLASSEMLECLSNIQKTVEAELNEKYQPSMKMLMPRMMPNLRKTQRLWISYRDAVCKAQYDWDGQFGKSSCIIKITRERIADIEAFYTFSR
jgi:uncharacterized protein YecT (DUF1311 family)